MATQSDKVPNLDETYTNLIKDADKLKLMLLAWNYQNSAAVQNGTSGPDLATMTSLWEQYQNALGISMANKCNDNASPVSYPVTFQRNFIYSSFIHLFRLLPSVMKMKIRHLTIKKKTKHQKMSLTTDWISRHMILKDLKLST